MPAMIVPVSGIISCNKVLVVVTSVFWFKGSYDKAIQYLPLSYYDVLTTLVIRIGICSVMFVEIPLTYTIVSI